MSRTDKDMPLRVQAMHSGVTEWKVLRSPWKSSSKGSAKLRKGVKKHVIRKARHEWLGKEALHLSQKSLKTIAFYW
jgi:hypothetical protein